MTKSVSLVGSTGSIGTQAVQVLRRAIELDSDSFEIESIGAKSSVDILVNQAGCLRPKRVAIVDKDRSRELSERLPPGIELLVGDEALVEISKSADIVLNSVVGFAGLPVTMEALSNGKTLALANKESLVAGAPVVQKVRQTPGAQLLPVDSEHCAIHQCLRSGRSQDEVSRLILTASGGPFRTKSDTELDTVTIEDALSHPTWAMGPKITIDSSTLMNKGLEVIEAHELFGVDYNSIEVVIHPQSIVHSMVEFNDGSLIAQLSNPDMKLPIGYCLSFPDRFGGAYGAIDIAQLCHLSFDLPKTETFRCLTLAYQAGRLGGSAPAWLNASNEIAVQAFLDGKVSWKTIPVIVEESLQSFTEVKIGVIDDIIEQDASARRVAEDLISKLS